MLKKTKQQKTKHKQEWIKKKSKLKKIALKVTTEKAFDDVVSKHEKDYLYITGKTH